MIKVGDRLPDVPFRVKGDDGTVAKVPVADIFGGKRVVLVGVPGAFTSTCHNSHIPTFIANIDELGKRGIDRIAVMAVNDHHVMREWGKALGAHGRIDFLADGSAEFTQATGLVNDATASGLGIRCKRFAMVVEDGVVTTLNIEPDNGKVTVSSAASILGAL